MLNEYMSESELESVSKKTGQTLAEQRKVRIVIEPRDGESYWQGALNGYFYRIKRGESVEVPEAIAELIEENERVRRLGRNERAAYLNGCANLSR